MSDKDDRDVGKLLSDFVADRDGRMTSPKKIIETVRERKVRRRRLAGLGMVGIAVGSAAALGFSNIAIPLLGNESTGSLTPSTGDVPDVSEATCELAAGQMSFAVSPPLDVDPNRTQLVSGHTPQSAVTPWLERDQHAEVVATVPGDASEVAIVNGDGETVSVLRMTWHEEAWYLNETVACLDVSDPKHGRSCGAVVHSKEGRTFALPPQQPNYPVGVSDFIGQGSIPACAAFPQGDGTVLEVRGRVAPVTLFTEPELGANDSAVVTIDQVPTQFILGD